MVMRQREGGRRCELKIAIGFPGIKNLRYAGLGQTYASIWLTNSLTCSAIAGADVNPGDSIPMNCTTLGNFRPRLMAATFYS